MVAATVKLTISSSYCSCCSLISVYQVGTAVHLGYRGSVSPQQKSPPFKDGLNVYFLRLVRTSIWCCTIRGLGMQSSDLGLSLSAGPYCAVLPSRAGINVLTIQIRCKARAPYDEIVHLQYERRVWDLFNQFSSGHILRNVYYLLVLPHI